MSKKSSNASGKKKDSAATKRKAPSSPKAPKALEAAQKPSTAVAAYSQAQLVQKALRAASRAQELADAAGITLPAQPAEPVVADRWLLDASTAPATLSFEVDGELAATLPLDQEGYGQLLQALNGAYILPDDEPLNYQVRIPDLPAAPPVLSLIRGSAVVGSLALDEEFNENVGSILRDTYRPKPEVPAGVRFKRWVRKHKVYTALLILLALPILYTLGQGVFYSIAGSFN